MERRWRVAGQALTEVVLLVPVIGLLVAIPVVAARWGAVRHDGIEAARQAAWEATIGEPSRQAGVSASRAADGRVRAESRSTPTGHPGVGAQPTATSMRAVAALYTVPTDAGTEPRGLARIRAGWLGGPPGRVAYPLLRALLQEEPVRVNFGARPDEPAR